MTELDLIALGIWWIPIPLPGARGRPVVNAWAIEDAGGGITLFDCGLDSLASLSVLAEGLAEAGAFLGDVECIILSHDHAEHSGGLRGILERTSRTVAVFASWEEPSALRGTVGRGHPLRDGDHFQFRHFHARAVHMPGHTAELTCLFAEEEGILFSSDHLLHGAVPIATCDRTGSGATAQDVYRRSLLRTGSLDVRVVLPGRGAPFAGHRRVVGEVLSVVGRSRRRDRRGAAGRRVDALSLHGGMRGHAAPTVQIEDPSRHPDAGRSPLRALGDDRRGSDDGRRYRERNRIVNRRTAEMPGPTLQRDGPGQ